MTDRQDITHLKPQAIYETPSRRRVWVSLLNESSSGLFIKTVQRRSAAPPLDCALKSVITWRVCHTDIIPRIHETQKNDYKRQYGAAEIRTQHIILWALHRWGSMPFWNQCQHLSLNKPCCHAAKNTVLVVWQGVIINMGIEGDKSLVTIKDSSIVKKRSA